MDKISKIWDVISDGDCNFDESVDGKCSQAVYLICELFLNADAPGEGHDNLFSSGEKVNVIKKILDELVVIDGDPRDSK